MIGYSSEFIIGAALPAQGLEDGGFAVHLARVSELGHSAALVRLPWAQLQPATGQFDTDLIGRYGHLCESLRAAGIEPLCVLWDECLPQWFEAQGGWKHPDAAGQFSAYAARVAKTLAPHCQWWVPLVEPEYWLARTYHERARSGYRRALAQMTRAHIDSAAALRAARPDVHIGLSVRVFSAEPADTDSPWDFGAAQRLEHRLNHRMAERLRESGGQGAFDFALASWGGVVSAWFSPWRWRREWVLTMNGHKTRISLRDACRDIARFDEALSALLGHQAPLLVMGDGFNDKPLALDEQLRSLAARCAEEGGDRMIGFLLRAPVDKVDWERNRPLLETLRTGAEPWPREMDA